MKNGDMDMDIDMGKQGKCFGYDQGEQEICMGREERRARLKLD